MQSHNKSTRVSEIEKQLGFSFLIRGQKTPPIQELTLQATLIDAKLNPSIESKHIELLFDISRPKSWNPSLTELEKAYLTDRFKAEFPRKAFVSSNLMKTLPISQEQADIYEANREKLKNFNWRKK
jgi:hypothetical protein